LQAIYNYIPWILAAIGALTSFIGYYLDIICQVSYERILWVGVFLLLTIGGFINGRLIQKLNLSSHTDFLTGLWNRRCFYLRLDEEESRATRRKTPLCIAMIDVDNFKKVNDIYGHDRGDAVLSEIAMMLYKNMRTTDIVTRWGGDEFAIIFSATFLTEACEVMERIRHKVEAAFKSSYNLTISIGIMALEPNQDLKDLLIKADQALYKAKTQKNMIITVKDNG
jgi:diguanylate cyclase (GGDEF)-like protein